MGFHTYDPGRADALEDESRYEYLSADELLALFDPPPEGAVLDIGSGTGFYTDDVAGAVGHVYALDVQPEMHAKYREKGVPENVSLLTAVGDALPFRTRSLDGAFSTMTYHEFATEDALAELFRVLRPGALVGIGDWSRSGAGEAGPPRDERFDAATARDHFEAAGFDVELARDRRETFVVSARKPE
jgi:ubiquinone/menaquinone biosynthesis C-methylase UbiE